MHGEGTFTWSDGTSYQGQFNNGQMTGEGRWPNVLNKTRWDHDICCVTTKTIGMIKRYEAADGGVFEGGVYYPDGSDRSVGYEALFDGITLKWVAMPELVWSGSPPTSFWQTLSLLENLTRPCRHLMFAWNFLCRYRNPPPPAPSKGGKGKGGYKGK